MDSAISEFLAFFGLDASSIPEPVLAVICVLLLFLVFSVFCDIVAYIFKRTF